MGWDEWRKRAAQPAPAEEVPMRAAAPRHREHRLHTADQAFILAFYRLHQADVRRRFGPIETIWPCQQFAYPILSRTESISPIHCPLERLAIARGCLP